ncbi:hypothetical protein V8F06_004168 [Rhypophila decipiens]
MDLWSRWLDQPVESSPQDDDPGASPLVGVVLQPRAPDRSTAVAAVCSAQDGDGDDKDQRQEEELEDVEQTDESEGPKEEDTTELPVPTLFAPDSATSFDLPLMALEDSSPNLHYSRRMTLMRGSHNDSASETRKAHPEEGDGNQNNENDSYPKLPSSRPERDPHPLFRPTSMSRPNRPSPLSSSSRSSQYITSGPRPRMSPMAPPSSRISRQYATRPLSILSPATTQHVGHSNDAASWKVWEDGLDPDASQAPSANRGKLLEEETRSDLLYPCPFRRRNPARFNVRDHTHCAKTLFGSTQELRHHITSYHRRKRVLHQCRRCKLGFESENALDQHMMLPKDQICESISEESVADPEDGITDSVDRELVVGHASVETWEDIWRVVFPADEDVPAPDFHPIVELVEVEQQFNDGQDTLKASLQETLRLFLPPETDSDFCRFLAGQLELTFETHRANTMRNCLNRTASPGTDAHLQHEPPPTAHSADHAVLARRQKRNSKRTSILYSTSVPSTPRFPLNMAENTDHTTPLPLHSLTNITPSQLQRSHSTRSSNRASRLFLSLPPSHAIHARSPTPSPQTPVTGALSMTSGDNQSDYDCSRESRDSGIGIPCEVCEIESCQCREMARSSDTLVRASSQGQSQRRTLRHCQPGLRIKTDNTCNNTWTGKGNVSPSLGSMTAGSSGSGGSAACSSFLMNIENQDQPRPFSPQSFKQRVMRKVSGEP